MSNLKFDLLILKALVDMPISVSLQYSLGIEVDSVMFALKDDEFGDAVPESQVSHTG